MIKKTHRFSTVNCIYFSFNMPMTFNYYNINRYCFEYHRLLLSQTRVTEIRTVSATIYKSGGKKKEKIFINRCLLTKHAMWCWNKKWVLIVSFITVMLFSIVVKLKYSRATCWKIHKPIFYWNNLTLFDTSNAYCLVSKFVIFTVDISWEKYQPNTLNGK